jgi:putative AdoMet-dependent methyltransferase
VEVNGLFHSGEFDRWAADYDAEVGRGQGFPFEGYDSVLQRVFERAQVEPRLTVLELGCGTGNLTARFVQAGCRVWGSDFSAEMLKMARRKIAGAHFFQHELGKPLPADVPQRYARIVSTYVFHHFDPAGKIALLNALRAHLEPGGWIVIGDIAFIMERRAGRQNKPLARHGMKKNTGWLRRTCQPCAPPAFRPNSSLFRFVRGCFGFNPNRLKFG